MNDKNLQRQFEQLAEEHKASIYSICYMYVDSREEADDLYQEVLVKLWQGLLGFRGECAVRSWVYRISLNTCISYKRKKRPATVPLDLSPDIFDDRTPAGQRNQLLHSRITKLDKFDRAIVLLWLEDMSYADIGAIVGISPRAVGVRLVRIKEKLKSI